MMLAVYPSAVGFCLCNTIQSHCTCFSAQGELCNSCYNQLVMGFLCITSELEQTGLGPEGKDIAVVKNHIAPVTC